MPDEHKIFSKLRNHSYGLKMSRCKVIGCKNPQWFDVFCEEHYPYDKDIRVMIKRCRIQRKLLIKKIVDLCELFGITSKELERAGLDEW